jgi:AcrR family transcriptional regulator
MNAEKHGYHHGDLRRALLEAGLALLESHGLAGLTLRRAAAAAGVSHAAPAHYFPTLKALLTAIAAIGFERFGLAMAQARAEACDTAADQIRAAGEGYVAFAVRNPALFRLMFSQSLLDWEDETLNAAATASFAQLQEITAPASEGAAPRIDQAQLIKLLWCVVHGYAHLYIEGQMQWLDGDPTATRTAPHPPDIAGLLRLAGILAP